MSEVNQAANQPAPIRLTITMTPDGNVNVDGPINDKVLSYGLLEVAKQIIASFNPGQVEVNAKDAAPRIQVPDAITARAAIEGSKGH